MPVGLDLGSHRWFPELTLPEPYCQQTAVARREDRRRQPHWVGSSASVARFGALSKFLERIKKCFKPGSKVVRQALSQTMDQLIVCRRAKQSHVCIAPNDFALRPRGAIQESIVTS